MSADADEELVAVALVVKVRGLKGEVVAELLTDFPERFEGLERLIAVRPDGSRQSLELEDHWLQGERIVLKFAGYDSIEAATALVGDELTVPESERVELEEDEYYDWELEGCRVEKPDGESVGVVRAVMHTGASDLLVVLGAEGREHLIPLVEEICVGIDIEARLIRIDAPEGLLDF
ncbi:MAG: 16S rRNA processing protein RimM [Acidobacteria bacterium]|nr:16S rRNA processing protein RimM [Acidobacteriota bacterium]